MRDRWRLRGGAIAIAGIGLAMACGDGEMEPPIAGCRTTETPSFELGTGDSAFRPLTDGDALQMASGIQGGCHFWLSLRTDGFAPRRFNVRYDVLRASTGMSTGSSSSQRVTLSERADAAGLCEVVGFTAFLIEPWNFRDEDVIVRVTVTDDLGKTAMQERRVRATWPDPVAGVPDAELCGPQG